MNQRIAPLLVGFYNNCINIIRCTILYHNFSNPSIRGRKSTESAHMYFTYIEQNKSQKKFIIEINLDLSTFSLYLMENLVFEHLAY